ncbi:trypsin-like cysteine/serine peptidase domain-containing protein, partial [Hyaloraphidium curvatum]
VGGEPVPSAASFPFLARLVFAGRGPYGYGSNDNCSGSLVGPRVVVTSGECARRVLQNPTTIEVGRYDLTLLPSAEGAYVFNTTFVEYSEYATIALVGLSEPLLVGTGPLQPVTFVAGDTSVLPINAVATAAGFGRGNDGLYSSSPMMVNLTVQQKIQERIITKDPYKGLCNDEGSALVVGNGAGSWLLVGLGAYYGPCGSVTSTESTFWRISYYSDWITARLPLFEGALTRTTTTTRGTRTTTTPTTITQVTATAATGMRRLCKSYQLQSGLYVPTLGVASLQLDVSSVGRIWDVVVELRYYHVYPYELVVELQAPRGQQSVTLLRRAQCLPSTFLNAPPLMLDDHASASSMDCSGNRDPYIINSLRPYQPLTLMRGVDADGPWILVVNDTGTNYMENTYPGRIFSLCLHLNPAPRDLTRTTTVSKCTKSVTRTLFRTSTRSQCATTVSKCTKTATKTSVVRTTVVSRTTLRRTTTVVSRITVRKTITSKATRTVVQTVTRTVTG